jgi:hypothetical protein
LFGLGTAGTIAIIGGIGGATLATVLVLQDGGIESISAPAPLQSRLKLLLLGVPIPKGGHALVCPDLNGRAG